MLVIQTYNLPALLERTVPWVANMNDWFIFCPDMKIYSQHFPDLEGEAATGKNKQKAGSESIKLHCSVALSLLRCSTGAPRHQGHM